LGVTFERFASLHLEELERGQEYDLYGFKPVGVLAFLNDTHEIKEQAHNILRQRAARQRLSSKRCKSVKRSQYLFELTTDGGARFLYFQDGPRRLIVVSSTYKMKEKKFHAEVERGERLRSEYLKLKEGLVQ
jgi:hypothetical protein